MENYSFEKLKALYTDEEGNYKIEIGEHIKYRYEILSILGTGSYGKVKYNKVGIEML